MNSCPTATDTFMRSEANKGNARAMNSQFSSYIEITMPWKLFL
jgi:hypothetical protein